MSALNIVLLTLATAYLIWTAYRIGKLVWVEGAKGEAVDAEDAAMIVLRDLWKVIKLPYVAYKASRKKA